MGERMLERFPEKWEPVFHEKARPNTGLELFPGSMEVKNSSDRGGAGLRVKWWHGAGAWLFWPAFVLSVGAHVYAATLLLARDPLTPGAQELPTVAISVNIEATNILDSPEQDAAASSAASRATPEQAEVKEPDQPPEETAPPPEPQPPKAEDEAKPREDELEKQRLAEEELKRQADEADARRLAEEADRQAAETARLQQERLAQERRRLQREAEEREEEARRRQEMALKIAEEERRRKRRAETARPDANAAQGQQASKGRVSASQGSVLNYKKALQARIERNKPPRGDDAGQVKVAFTISPSGGLTSVRIMTSSGKDSLRQAALAAVRRSSPFPPPPPGMSASQLYFSILINFR